MASNSNGNEPVARFASSQEEALLTLMRSADCLHRALQLRLKPFGITATQYNVLRILRGAQATGLTCSAVGRMMITPVPDITRLLARLMTQKLVSQQRDADDRRVVWTHITTDGLSLLERLEPVMETAPKDLLRELTREETQDLTRLLHKARCCEDASSEPASNQRAMEPDATAKLPSPRFARSLPLRPRPE